MQTTPMQAIHAGRRQSTLKKNDRIFRAKSSSFSARATPTVEAADDAECNPLVVDIDKISPTKFGSVPTMMCTGQGYCDNW